MNKERLLIDGYSNYYVSKDGKVFCGDRELKGFKTGKYRNYLAVVLYKNGEHKQYKIHRLVAQAFIPNPNNLPQVNHKDGNTFNNNVTNLEWCDNSHNQKHAWANGLNHRTENSIEPPNLMNKINNSNPIALFNLDYELLNIYSNNRVCARENKIDGSTIYKACKYEVFEINNKYCARLIKDCTIKNKLLIICGKTASGKTSIVKELCKNKYNEIKSVTTRPKRNGETNEYYFINEEEYINMAKNGYFFNSKAYHTEYGYWYYASRFEDVFKYDNPILIVDEAGFLNIKNRLGEQNIISVLIKADADIRKERALKRDNATEINRKEIERRMKDDDLKFTKEEEYDLVLNNNTKEEFDNNIKLLLELNNKNLQDKYVKPLKFKNGVMLYDNKIFNLKNDLYNYIRKSLNINISNVNLRYWYNKYKDSYVMFDNGIIDLKILKEELNKRYYNNPDVVGKRTKKVKMYKDDKLLGIYNSVKCIVEEYKELNLLEENIGAVCNKRQKYHKGFYFEYM